MDTVPDMFDHGGRISVLLLPAAKRAGLDSWRDHTVAQLLEFAELCCGDCVFVMFA